MGNEESKQSSHGRMITVSAPRGGLQMIPTPERTQAGLPVRHHEHDINRSSLLTAFKYMAIYLRIQKADITIIAVGGAVNTIYLQTREVTHDVDFFGGNEQSRLLKDASKYAQQQSEFQLGTNWLNNSTSLFIPRDLLAQLTSEAIQQNVVLFREEGLTVLAAPWIYALSGKASRMSGPDRRSYDCQDAVGYLREHILLNGMKSALAREIEDWGKKYGNVMAIGALKDINNKYKDIYGGDGIVF